MASIKIFELHPAGSNLFQDAESFLNELSHHELAHISGAGSEMTQQSNSVVSQYSISVGAVTDSQTSKKQKLTPELQKLLDSLLHI